MRKSGKRPTIADVARAAGVSKGTVSFALNDRPGVSAPRRAEIVEIARRMGWEPDARARALSTSRASAIGMVIARPPQLLGSDPFFAPFIAGVEATLGRADQALMLQVVPDATAERRAYRRLAASARVDGVLLTDLRLDDERPALLTELGMPALAVGRQHSAPMLPFVALDDRAGITAAVEHVIGLGHRRIGFVGGPAALVHGTDRRDAWAQALRDAGLAPGPYVEADFSAAGGAKATTALMRRRSRPTAIIYANDLMAAAGAASAATAGFAIPDDLSIVGFDDIELGAHLRPPLTSIRTDVVGWGAACAQALIEVIDSAAHPAVELPPAELVLRGSTAPPPPEPSTPRPRATQEGSTP